ncbi:MAG: Fe(3+) ABC transporter substrate-binding protein [Verrucomicrobiota bacterium]
MKIKTTQLFSMITLACGLLMHSAFSAEEVNIYSHRHYDADKQLFEKFTETTGIKVNIVKAKADQLIERLLAEGEYSPADLLMTADIGRLHKARELKLLQAAESEYLKKNIPENLRDKDNQWFALTKRARVIAYHKDRVNPEDLSTIEALTDPKWKGKILIRSSTNIYNQSLIASMIAHHGVEKTEEWAKGFVANFARSPKGSDRDQMRAVVAGEGDLAIVNTYYLGILSNGDDKDKAVAEQIRIFFPNQGDRGTHVNVSGVGLTRYAKNKDNAIKLMDFLASAQAQSLFAQANFEYPVIDNIKSSELVESWGNFKEDTISLSQVGLYNEAAIKLSDRVGWE